MVFFTIIQNEMLCFFQKYRFDLIKFDRMLKYFGLSFRKICLAVARIMMNFQVNILN